MEKLTPPQKPQAPAAPRPPNGSRAYFVVRNGNWRDVWEVVVTAVGPKYTRLVEKSLVIDAYAKVLQMTEWYQRDVSEGKT